jgi:amino acid transporter
MSEEKPRLKKALGLRDLVLFNIACVVGLSSLTQAAQFGWSSFPLWILAMVFFLIPSGLMVIDLNTRVPGEGGFYIWTKKAFGEWHGFVAAWRYWLSNVVWFPAVLFTIVLSSLYIFGDDYLHLRDNFWVTGVISMLILWLIIILNIYGLKFGKWIQNIGAISLWLLFALLFTVAIIYVSKHGSAQPVSVEAFIPNVEDLTIIPFFAAIAYSFGGLELSSIMSDEIKDPQKNITKSIFISGVVIAILYMIGTFSLLVALPKGELDIVDGIAQTFHSIDASLGIPLVGSIGALLATLSVIGALGGWLSGSARLPFVIGIDSYLPKVLGKVHPKYGTPYMALIIQGIVISILFVFSIAGSGVQEAFSVIYDMAVVLYFIPFLYMFAAFLKHNLINTGGKSGVAQFEKHKSLVWICASLGFSVIFLSIILAFMPSNAIENKVLFYSKIIGGTLFLISTGLLFNYKKRH